MVASLFECIVEIPPDFLIRYSYKIFRVAYTRFLLSAEILNAVYATDIPKILSTTSLFCDFPRKNSFLWMKVLTTSSRIE